MPCGVGTNGVGFIDIIAFGTDKQACLYDMNRTTHLRTKFNSFWTKDSCPYQTHSHGGSNRDNFLFDFAFSDRRGRRSLEF